MKISRMSWLAEELLISIFKRINSANDQKSFSRVSKHFLKVACICQLKKLRISLPDLLYHILPTPLNLVSFECSKPLSNTHMKLLAQSCPNLLYLNLNSKSDFSFDDDGLCAIANKCIGLLEVSLCGRSRVGDRGVAALVRSCKNLTKLDLGECVNVTNESLKAIGELETCKLADLSLRGCNLITYSGFEYLADGNVSNSIMWLDLSKCDITDCDMDGIAQKCWALTEIYLTGCKYVTGRGLFAFSLHRNLEYIELFSCDDISWEDVKNFLYDSRWAKVGLSRESMMRMHREFDEESEEEFDHFRIIWESDDES